MNSLSSTFIHSQAQALQDVFAAYINNFKKDGYFLDLGCNEPFICNNTSLLESWGWKGLLVDYNQSLVDKCTSVRKNKAICADLTKIKLSTIMNENNCPEIIDYFSMDLDDGAAWSSIQDFDFSKHKIRCITFEHDEYTRVANIKEVSREFLIKKGLKLICADVCIYNGQSFEDWYVNPKLVNENIYSKIECTNKEYSSIFDNLLWKI